MLAGWAQSNGRMMISRGKQKKLTEIYIGATAYHEAYVISPETEPEDLWSEASVKPLELWHSHRWSHICHT